MLYSCLEDSYICRKKRHTVNFKRIFRKIKKSENKYIDGFDKIHHLQS